MNYTLMIFESAEDFAAREDPAKQQAYWSRLPPFLNALRDAGVFVGGAGLQPPDSATTMTLRDGQRLIQDGPYAEAKEQLAGFFIINVPDLDRALEWAARYPVTPGGSVEVRPHLLPME
ncbi:MAG TPA: YciI family protein [Stellaceae bacterium]|nr:YciI family protein [Stellaceae bacterium]